MVFADKIIDAKTAEQIKEVIRMTQVAQLLLEEGRDEGRVEGKKKKEPRELKYWLTVSGHLPFLMKIS